MAQHEPADLEGLPTLSSAMGDELKIDGDEDGLRVWLEPHSRSVSYERLVGGRWRSCDAEGNRCGGSGGTVTFLDARDGRRSWSRDGA